MKTSLLTILAFFSYLTVSAFYIEVWGTVTDASNQQPVANHMIEISIDSAGGIFYYNTVITDENGFYSDSIYFDNSIGSESLHISTDSCNIIISRDIVFSQGNSNFFVPFSVCNYQSFDCNAFFTYYNSQEPYFVIFENLSMGNINEYQWDFGDGSTSSEENPIHNYPGFGTYLTTLTIYGDSCYDQYQSWVTVLNDTLYCQAYYTWENSVISPTTINFFDLSIGEISSWFWDFGDGTSSTEQNPQHNYGGYGFYTVTLSIGTIDSCFSNYTEIIEVYDDSINCNSSFTYYLDTLNNTPNTFHFIDQSSANTVFWYWDFGDGNFSYQQNPVHTYSEFGNYNVCLIVGTEDGNQYCTDDTCTMVSTFEYYYFGGQIFAGDYPINIDSTDIDNIAKVSLYRKIDNSWYFMDEGEFWRYGYYWFYDKPMGEYMVLAELTENSTIYNDYCPSYYPNSINWKSSATFSLINNDSYAVNISLRPLASSNTGIGIIEGLVYGDQSCNSFEELNYRNSIIQLLNEDGGIIDFTKPDTNGQYSFNNIADGNYTIKAEYPGKYSQSYTLTFDENNKFINQDLMVYCHNILSVSENNKYEVIKILNVYPNPATNYFSLTIESLKKTKVGIQIIDVSGKVLLSVEQDVYMGDNNLSVSTNMLPEGYYIIKATDKSTNFQSFKNLVIIN